MLVLFSVIKSTMNHTGACIKGAIYQFVVLSVHFGVLVGLSIAKRAMSLSLNTHLDSVISYGRPCFTQSTQMDHQPPTDGNIVTSVSEEGLQSIHQPVCCPNKYSLLVQIETKSAHVKTRNYVITRKLYVILFCDLSKSSLFGEKIGYPFSKRCYFTITVHFKCKLLWPVATGLLFKKVKTLRHQLEIKVMNAWRKPTWTFVTHN